MAERRAEFIGALEELLGEYADVVSPDGLIEFLGVDHFDQVALDARRQPHNVAGWVLVIENAPMEPDSRLGSFVDIFHAPSMPPRHVDGLMRT